MDKARRVFTTELNGNWVFQAGGVLNCNLKFDGATNTTNLHGSVTGVSLLSVLRQAVPLGKFPSQLERLQVRVAGRHTRAHAMMPRKSLACFRTRAHEPALEPALSHVRSLAQQRACAHPRLQVTGANMILINGKVAHIDFELDQLAADVIATVDPNALADAKAESPAKLDWLQVSFFASILTGVRIIDCR